jgi:hypothetical protein
MIFSSSMLKEMTSGTMLFCKGASVSLRNTRPIFIACFRDHVETSILHVNSTRYVTFLCCKMRNKSPNDIACKEEHVCHRVEGSINKLECKYDHSLCLLLGHF